MIIIEFPLSCTIPSLILLVFQVYSFNLTENCRFVDIKDFGKFLNDQQMNRKGMSADYELYFNEVLDRTPSSPEVFWGTGDVWSWGYMVRLCRG